MVDALELKIEFLTGVSVRVGPGAPTNLRNKVSLASAALCADIVCRMDARTSKKAPPDGRSPHAFIESSAKRDRLLASLDPDRRASGSIIALPFALRAGAEFFLPVTAALVIAIALVPMLEWFERRGVPSKLAAGLCVIIFLMIAVFAIGSIVLPAIDWVALIPERIAEGAGSARRRCSTSTRRLDKFHRPDLLADRHFASEPGRTVRIETPNSMLGLLTTSAPHLLIQLFFALLVIFFFLAGWTGDAQAHDRQPRQLRRRADDRARDPAGRRRDLDLHRHDHAHQRHAWAR